MSNEFESAKKVSIRSTTRNDKHRIFVNRSLQMEKIRFYGFDMDYTIANYKSPEFEELCFNLTRDVLINYGYPEEFRLFNYESHFSLRGLWFDREYGTFTKNDQYGNILLALIGFRFLSTPEIVKLYPNKFMKFDENRMYVMNTLFSLPEMYLLAKVINWFTHQPDYEVSSKGVQKDHVFMSYHSIMQDVRDATDDIHSMGSLKTETSNNLDKYVVKSEKLSFMLDRLRAEGRKTFLLTNSEYKYTSQIMNFILPERECNNVVRDWTTYFDYIVVDAKKPKFFIDGSILRAVDRETQRLIVGQHVGPLKTGHIYSGGSCEVFSKLIGSRGKDVLYVGDHIFGDILKSKKIVGWRTFLVIPELNNELNVWKNKQESFQELLALDNNLEEIYKDLDILSLTKPDVKAVKNAIKDLATTLEAAYGTLGSIFRNGSRLTFFSSQVQRYADLYASSCINLIHYPLCYMFRSQPMLLPHEVNVSNEDQISDPETEEYAYFCRTEGPRCMTNTHKSEISQDEEEEESTNFKDLAPSVPQQVRFVHTDVCKVPDFSKYRRHDTASSCVKTNEADRRMFSYTMVFGSSIIATITAKELVRTLLGSMGPSAKTMAAATAEVDLSNIPEGKNVVVKWRSKPLFVKHRTAEEIEREAQVDLAELRDPQSDLDRVQKPEWLIIVGICTHLGCVPIANAGEFHGYYCPCHGSHYDGSGRIRKGPAPENMEVPQYKFLDDKTVLVG